MRKKGLVLTVFLALSLCFLAGCSDDSAVESGVNNGVGYIQSAQDVVDENNNSVEEIESLDAEIEQ